jgi:menaquinone-dependent protoporphyrinogen IX oxidase
MLKVFVVYDTKYGNTRLVAEKIAEGMRETDGIEIAINDVKEVDLGRLADCDALLIGAPVHFGGPSRTITKFIDKVGKLELAKRTAVFDTYLKTDFEKGVKPMEARISEKIPKMKLIVPGLSIQVSGMEGPIADGELPKCVDFGKKIAAQLKTSPQSLVRPFQSSS